MRVIASPPEEIWERVVSRSPYATFFHTPAWSKVLVEAYPEFRIATRGLILDDGTAVIVPMVATTERNGYFQWRESMFPGGYGGAIAERTLTQTEIDAVYGHLTDARTAYLHVMGNPLCDHVLPSTFERSIDYTHVLDLSPGYDALYRRFRSGHKRHMKDALKLGVEVGLATQEADYRGYFAAYEDSLQRWGNQALARYPWEIFDVIHRSRSGHMKLWIAKVDGQVVSGCIVFYHNQHAIYWHGATRERFLDFGCGPLVTAEIIRNACETGCRWYDFSPSGRLQGVEWYKEGFGAQKQEFPTFVWRQNRIYRAYQSIIHALRRQSPQNGPNEAKTPAPVAASAEPANAGSLS